MDVFQWINDLASNVKTTVGGVGIALVLVFVIYHAIKSKLTLANMITSAIVGAIFIMLISGGLEGFAKIVKTTFGW